MLDHLRLITKYLQVYKFWHLQQQQPEAVTTRSSESVDGCALSLHGIFNLMRSHSPKTKATIIFNNTLSGSIVPAKKANHFCTV